MIIKKYEDFDRIDESFLIGFSTFLMILRGLVLIISYKKGLGGEKDNELMRELTEISGIKSPEIFALTKEKGKSPVACATVNRIYYDKNLKKLLTHRELISILLHELSHIKSKDTLKKQALWAFPFIPIILLDSWLLYFLAPLISNILISRPYDRKLEYKSDSFAGKYGYSEDLSTALVKIGHYFGKERREIDPKVANSQSFKLLKKLISLLQTHPELSKRVKNLKFLTNETPEEFVKRIETHLKTKEKVNKWRHDSGLL